MANDVEDSARLKGLVSGRKTKLRHQKSKVPRSSFLQATQRREVDAPASAVTVLVFSGDDSALFFGATYYTRVHLVQQIPC